MTTYHGLTISCHVQKKFKVRFLKPFLSLQMPVSVSSILQPQNPTPRKLGRKYQSIKSMFVIQLHYMAVQHFICILLVLKIFKPFKRKSFQLKNQRSWSNSNCSWYKRETTTNMSTIFDKPTSHAGKCEHC